ncbi:nucleoside recognition domain-containing protein [Proteiniphilum sp. X52]|uniref:nucleoside recognition domain-containing protein n=1 Tax=Proteiniphilum sp. X52 TaxID=2382159 RepID=UPI000F09CA47|nr:nucleoside recognition domain-containing protein [Proteiniphilum sp. X52]RNC66808.1 hypothetical protein D7D25_00635 [Proteiniphilum sp. X52]
MSKNPESGVRKTGVISLILALLFFSGIFKNAPMPLSAFDFTNILGTFGELGYVSDDHGLLAKDFRGTNGVGVRDGFLFSLSLIPAIIFALGLIKIVEDAEGLKVAQKLLTPLLRPLLGLPGICGLSLMVSLQSVDAGAALTKELHDNGQINNNERLIYTGFQFSGGGLITNYFSSGAALFPFLHIPLIIPLLIVLLFKFLAGNIIRILLLYLSQESQTNSYSDK